jgi:hypothetical protein
MKETLTMKLYRTLLRGMKQLGREAIVKVADFVKSQRSDNMAFIDKSGKPDIYYSAFGWLLSYVLDIKLNKKLMKAWLDTIDVSQLELVHYSAYVRCKMIRNLSPIALFQPILFQTMLSLKKASHLPIALQRTIISEEFELTPYNQFLILSLKEDLGMRKFEWHKEKSLNKYHLAQGGYSNDSKALTSSTNATVAALLVKGQSDGYKINNDVMALREQQDVTGGYRAAEASPFPDILSTATALFALKCYNLKPKYDVRDFIEAHWLDNGGFAATLADEQSDTEYTFYGLLALGTI